MRDHFCRELDFISHAQHAFPIIPRNSDGSGGERPAVENGSGNAPDIHQMFFIVEGVAAAAGVGQIAHQGVNLDNGVLGLSAQRFAPH